jgi:hypothetical protein
VLIGATHTGLRLAGEHVLHLPERDWYLVQLVSLNSSIWFEQAC